MIIPDKQIHNNFRQYESVFLQYSSMERIYTEVIPYHEFKNSPYHAFYVLEGAMSLKITGADGEEKISAVVKHGSFFTQSSKTMLPSALSSFMSCPSPKVRVLVFTKEEFKQLISEHIEIVLSLIRFYEDLTTSLQCELKDILFFDGKKRICNHLYACYLANNSLEIKTTQEMIGKHIGLDRTNVSKHLSELRALGIIETRRNLIHILNLEQIIEISNR